MTALKYRDAKRYTLDCPAEAIIPRGSDETLEKALTCLGPFDYANESEADASVEELDPSEPGWMESRQEAHRRKTCSKEFVRREIVRIARNFNWGRRQSSKKPPRHKHTQQELEGLIKHLRVLEDALNGLSEFASGDIQQYADRMRSHREYWRQFDWADPQYFPVPGDSRPSIWAQRAQRLAEFIADVHEWKDSQFRHAKADKGGKQDRFYKEYGDPRQQLVANCLRHFERHHPSKASTYVDGPFHYFVKCVFEYATGLDGEERSALTHAVKVVVSAFRKAGPIRGKLEALQGEYHRLQKLPPTPQTRQQSEALLLKIGLLAREWLKCSSRFLPKKLQKP